MPIKWGRGDSILIHYATASLNRNYLSTSHLSDVLCLIFDCLSVLSLKFIYICVEFFMVLKINCVVFMSLFFCTSLVLFSFL